MWNSLLLNHTIFYKQKKKKEIQLAFIFSFHLPKIRFYTNCSYLHTKKKWSDKFSCLIIPYFFFLFWLCLRTILYTYICGAFEIIISNFVIGLYKPEIKKNQNKCVNKLKPARILISFYFLHLIINSMANLKYVFIPNHFHSPNSFESY